MSIRNLVTATAITTTAAAAFALTTTPGQMTPLSQGKGLDDASRSGASPTASAGNPQFELTLGEQIFDPAQVVPANPGGWDLSNDDPNGRNLRLIQFDGPIQESWLEDLTDLGVEVVQYIHPYTYIVWSTEADRDASMDNPNVRWTGDFVPAYRVLPRYRNLGAAEREVRVVLYRGADVDAAMQQLEAIAGRAIGKRAIDSTLDVAIFNMSGDDVLAAAQVPGVYSIQPVPTDGGLRGEMTNQLNVGNYDGNNQAFPGYQTWLDDSGVDGTGIIIANVDGGVQSTHPDLINRFLPCNGTTCSTGDSSHGTHTAGIMAADGASGTTDGNGFLRGLGVAPGANLIEQQYSPWFTQPGGMLLLMTDSYNNGALLSGNSWGPAGSPQGYDSDTRQVDVGVRDADPDAAGNQPLTYVLSFMNGNGGNQTQGSPDEAKNIFNIGSTKGQNSNGSQILDINDLSSNTAHGPALDGRTIPHMVAPGCRVDSTVTGNSYSLLCGTSMASPHVSGAVALFIERYRQQPDYVADPSPALIKAAFLPVCHDLAGFDDADGNTLGHPFDSKQGWGRMNLDAVVNSDVDGVRYIDNPQVLNQTGDEWTFTISPLDPSKPMKVMLVWTDAPGHGLGGSTPAWNNDLDLIVEANGTYYGNNFGGDGWSDTGGSADDRNNTEGVFLGPIPPSSATIRVVASNLTSDGIPNFGDGIDQDFAIVAYNAAQEPGFTIGIEPIDQETCAPSNIDYDIEIGQILGYDQAVTLSANDVPANTTVIFSENPVVPPANVTMTVMTSGSTPFGDFTIDVEGVSGEIVRNANAGLDVSNAIPQQVSLLNPVNGAVNVSLAPDLDWNDAAQAAMYELNVATDPNYNNIILTDTMTESGYEVGSPLDTLTSYYWRVRAVNACGVGAWSDTFVLTTLDAPAILLVDDDDNSPNVRPEYTALLDNLGFEYDVWDTNNSDNEPDAATLAQYRVVIWFTGDEFGGSCGPGSAGEAALAGYLDSGRCLFLSSQDYLYDRGLTSFMTNYLGMSGGDSDVAQTTVTAAGSVFGGMGTMPLSYPFSNWSDELNPGLGEAAFVGNNGDAALNYDAGEFRTVFLGFPLEAVQSTSSREEILVTYIDWCSELFEVPCPGNIDGDPGNQVNVDDLLLLLSNWGTDGVGADIAAPLDIVDVNDLLALLAAWGPCPE